jgi:transposase InsO family protein
MPWMKECLTVLDRRQEFVELAVGEGRNMALLCRRFGISRKTGYKWLGRYRAGNGEDLVERLSDRSRRPQQSPTRTSESMEQQVVALRKKHRGWGGRKLSERLKVLGGAGADCVPAPSTITGILRRHGLLDEADCQSRRRPHRFEHEAPNDLWQMDYKGHVGMSNGKRCHPLTVLDDHSRFSLALVACGDEQATTVQQHLTTAFRAYGMPCAILSDNGSPWGTSGWGEVGAWTGLAVWLVRLGVELWHGRPCHPQTQGKEERFHRTLVAELLRWETFSDLADAQPKLDAWRFTYNHERPHEALGLKVPAQRYQPSAIAFPRKLPAIEYGPDDLVRRVRPDGRIEFFQQKITIGAAFRGQDVALRPTRQEGVWDAYYCAQHIGRVDQRSPGSEGRLRRYRPLAGDTAARESENL